MAKREKKNPLNLIIKIVRVENKDMGPLIRAIEAIELAKIKRTEKGI